MNIIPHAALTQHLIALGKTGSGKSSKLRVLVEEILTIGTPVCILDPKGDWWGLKSSADGKKSGFPLVIFGGEHADVPINEHSGAHVAELVATGNRSCIIDLGGWMIGARTRFFIEFASTLFKLARGARHLVIDEVHNFAPQGKVLDPDAGRLLHWANRLASEGRGKGLTIIAASQRPQKVHKDFLTSCETLIACKVIHKLDRDAIKDWIDGCADPAAGRQVIAELAQLKKPEAWVWSPEIELGPVRITFPMFKTYDSFKPQAHDVGKLAGWASVDLDDVKAKLTKVVEDAKANDPRELKRKIDALNKEVIALRKDQPPIYDGAAEERGFTRGLAYGQNLANNIRVALLAMVDANDRVVAGMESILSQINGNDPGAKFVYSGPRVTHESKPAAAEGHALSMRKSVPVRAAQAAERRTDTVGGSSLAKAERAILTALVHSGGCAAKSKVAVMAGYSISGGGFNNALGSLRTKGFILPGEPIQATSDGIAAVGDVGSLPQGDELLAHWMGQLGKAEGSALKVIFDAYPNYIEKDEVAAATGYEASGGGFNNALGRLRTLELIEGRGAMRASTAFFP